MSVLQSFNFSAQNTLSEDFIVSLDALGFDGMIEHSENQIEAFISSSISELTNFKSELQKLIQKYSVNIEISEVEEKNWNEKWESSFKPVVIEDEVLIRAPFHKKQDSIKHEVIIEPKMSFGTGHHATTFLMAQFMLKYDFENKIVLDAGCGTGILTILAEKLGANVVIGFDNEEWAYENSIENLERNNCNRSRVFLGDAQGLPFENETYDIVLANITKNILKEDIPVYLQYLDIKGFLLISGFFEENINEMKDFATKYGLKFLESRVRNNWASIVFQKTS